MEKYCRLDRSMLKFNYNSSMFYEMEETMAVSGDTLLFNGFEWKRVDEYVDGEKALQFMSSGSAELVVPLVYRVYHPVLMLEGTGELPICADEGHRIVYLNSKSGALEECKYSKLLGISFISKWNIPVSCLYQSNVILNSREIDLYVSKFKSVEEDVDDRVYVADVDSRRKIFEGVFGDSSVYSTSDYKKAFCMYCLLSLTGMKCNLQSQDNAYKVLWKKGSPLPINTISWDGKYRKFKYNYNNREVGEYNVLVPSGRIVAMRKGKIFILGDS